MRASGSLMKLFQSSDRSTRLNLRNLLLVWDLTMKKSFDRTNWLGAGAALLMSPRQGKTN